MAVGPKICVYIPIILACMFTAVGTDNIILLSPYSYATIGERNTVTVAVGPEDRSMT